MVDSDCVDRRLAGCAAAGVSSDGRQAAAPTRRPAAEVLAFEREIEDAVVRGDVRFVDAASASTFTFTHGDGWTTGGAPLRVDSRADWLATVARAPYASRVLDSVKTEVHGDVVITYGRYVAASRTPNPGAGSSRCGSSGCTRSATDAGNTCRIARCMGRLR